jgi:hypothetical protein
VVQDLLVRCWGALLQNKALSKCTLADVMSAARWGVLVGAALGLVFEELFVASGPLRGRYLKETLVLHSADVQAECITFLQAYCRGTDKSKFPKGVPRPVLSLLIAPSLRGQKESLVFPSRSLQRARTLTSWPTW